MNPSNLSEPEADPSNTLQAIFDALQKGRGREQVTDANIEGLIDMARHAGDAQLELLLREWRSACGDDPDSPTLPAELPPPPGQR